MKVKNGGSLFTVFGVTNESEFLLFGNAYGKDTFMWVAAEKVSQCEDDNEPVAKPRVWNAETKECYIVHAARKMYSSTRGNMNAAQLLVFKKNKFTWIDCKGFVECEKKVEVKKELNIEIKRDSNKSYGY